MTYNCEKLERDAQLVLSIRTKTSVQQLPQLIGETYMKIMQYLGEQGKNPSNAPFVGYFNLDMQNLDVEIGFPVSKKLPERDDIKASEIPAGNYTSCIYTGPYDKIQPAYNALTEWSEKNGYETSGIAYELYIDDPGVSPPEELKTQILFLLK
ncbi:MAG: GyrI-like domain-containing protein [Candidatus Lokiarchaeota archaeon]|nr:GyrI-like domain-containing protein [Candidatus Lokiarchaeota archaeon]